MSAVVPAPDTVKPVPPPPIYENAKPDMVLPVIQQSQSSGSRNKSLFGQRVQNVNQR